MEGFDPSALMIAIDLVEQGGMPDEAEVLRKLVRCYRPDPSPMYVHIQGDVRHYHPVVSSEVARWAEDPSPKLPGLMVWVRLPWTGMNLGALPDAEIRLEAEHQGERVAAIRAIHPQANYGPGYVTEVLDLLQRELVRMIRGTHSNPTG